ncbi:hypothetical protein ACPSUI_004532, partial [Escherichia coli]
MNECCLYFQTGVARLTGLKTYRQLPGFYSRQLYVRHPFSFFHVARFPAVREGGYAMAEMSVLCAYEAEQAVLGGLMLENERWD